MLYTVLPIVFALAAIIKPLRNGFYFLHILLVSGTAWLLEQQGWQYKPFSEQAIISAMIIHLVFINIITFASYGYDKHAAKNQKWRISERTLHAFSFIGGVPGAVAGQKTFRHKTKKQSFRSMFWMVFIFQIIVIIALAEML